MKASVLRLGPAPELKMDNPLIYLGMSRTLYLEAVQ